MLYGQGQLPLYRAIDSAISACLILNLIRTAGEQGFKSEIYTRLEQVFDPTRSEAESLLRLRQLHDVRPQLSRVFVGVESGCDAQLRRYGKGQTTTDIVAALRAASVLDLPCEFGFITFDPLLKKEEFADNLEFLSRRDIWLSGGDGTPERAYAIASAEQVDPKDYGDPLFARVAYMATELELFASSPFLKHLASSHPHLIGRRDPSFARYEYSYDDPIIGDIAGWCRVWTEGTFAAIYRMRLARRAQAHANDDYERVIRRYREASFVLMASLARSHGISIGDGTADVVARSEAPVDSSSSRIAILDLDELWRWVESTMPGLRVSDHVAFDLTQRERRRDA